MNDGPLKTQALDKIELDALRNEEKKLETEEPDEEVKFYQKDVKERISEIEEKLKSYQLNKDIQMEQMVSSDSEGEASPRPNQQNV